MRPLRKDRIITVAFNFKFILCGYEIIFNLPLDNVV
jgi:hypothetical protein